MRGGKRDESGRPKGSKNKKTLEWERFGSELMGGQNLDRVMQIMDELPPLEFLKYFIMLAEYFKPKLSRSTVSGEIDIIIQPTPIQVADKKTKMLIEKI
jgi:hypothetical protein